MWPENSFVTLTYSPEKLKSPKLDYKDVQAFVKALRNYRFDYLMKELFGDLPQVDLRVLWQLLPKERKDYHFEKIRMGFVTVGEYGTIGARPHWHLLVFNFRPTDATFKYSNARGDKVFSSNLLDSIWKNGIAEFGEVTFESAGYCARYSAKKLAHGRDGEHDYVPLSRRSSKNAIGRKWIEKNWEDVFTSGRLVFKKGDEMIECGIPRYYEKWLQKNKPERWCEYVVGVKSKIISQAAAKEAKISLEEKKCNLRRSARRGLMISKNQTRDKILKKKFRDLQDKLKL